MNTFSKVPSPNLFLAKPELFQKGRRERVDNLTLDNVNLNLRSLQNSLSIRLAERTSLKLNISEIITMIIALVQVVQVPREISVIVASTWNQAED
jgi:hypothetical protein